MIRTERFKGLEEKIGYTFTNKRTLALAMTHSSYANEQRGRRKENNERLEFLGDAVLEVTISDYVFREYPGYNEGRLTKLRSSLVCEYTLAICAISSARCATIFSLIRCSLKVTHWKMAKEEKAGEQ